MRIETTTYGRREISWKSQKSGNLVRREGPCRTPRNILASRQVHRFRHSQFVVEITGLSSSRVSTLEDACEDSYTPTTKTTSGGRNHRVFSTAKELQIVSTIQLDVESLQLYAFRQLLLVQKAYQTCKPMQFGFVEA